MTLCGNLTFLVKLLLASKAMPCTFGAGCTSFYPSGEKFHNIQFNKLNEKDYYGFYNQPGT